MEHLNIWAIEWMSGVRGVEQDQRKIDIQELTTQLDDIEASTKL